MKKNSNSQSAFFNPRALIGLFVCLAGMLIAFFASGVQPTAPQANQPQAANGMTRQEMVALYGALAPADFSPPACVAGSEMFTDVPASNPFCPWIEELSRRGITAGCAPGLFCPSASVTRAQMAPFLIKASGPRAYAIAGRGTDVATDHIKGQWSVRRPTGEPIGVFCLAAEGIDARVNPAIVTVEWGLSSGFDLLAYWWSGSEGQTTECNPEEYEVLTYKFPGGVPTLSDSVEFLITIPNP
jgi:hypothetical protein